MADVATDHKISSSSKLQKILFFIRKEQPATQLREPAKGTPLAHMARPAGQHTKIQTLQSEHNHSREKYDMDAPEARKIR
jgi:hypothetical protein